MDPFISARSHAVTALDIFSPAPLRAGAQRAAGGGQGGCSLLLASKVLQALKCPALSCWRQVQASPKACHPHKTNATLTLPANLSQGQLHVPAGSRCVMGPGGSVLGPHGDPLLPGQGQVKSRQSGRRAGGGKERN